MFNCGTIGDARKKQTRYSLTIKVSPSQTCSALDKGFESAVTVQALPAGLRRFCRASNHIERLNRELKRRSSVISIFPNEESLVKTMSAVLIEESHNKESGRVLCSSKIFKEFMTPEVKNTLFGIGNGQHHVMAAPEAITYPLRKGNLLNNPDFTGCHLIYLKIQIIKGWKSCSGFPPLLNWLDYFLRIKEPACRWRRRRRRSSCAGW